LAKPAGIAFGRYMRTLRQRKELSIQEVCRVLLNASEGTDAGSLSRLERGRQQLAAGKLAALCRVYEVSPAVPLERLDLDHAVEQHVVLDTDGKSAAVLLDLGRKALERAERWDAYACFRDALLEDVQDDHALRFNLATAARAMGRFRFALHEFEVLGEDCRDRPLHPAVLERIASTLRSIGDLDSAERYAWASAEAARSRDDARTLGYAFTSLANVNIARLGDPELTVDYLNMAHRAARDSKLDDGALVPNAHFEVSTLNSLAETYLASGRDESARRAAAAALKLSDQHGFRVGRAYAQLFLGQVDESCGREERAEERWREALATAESAENKRLSFCAQFYLFRQALRLGEFARSKVLRRSLQRLAPWVPEQLPLLADFRSLAAGDAKRTPDKSTQPRAGSTARTRRQASRAQPPTE